MAKMNLQKIKKNRGFVILFAVTISAILLAIALGVGNVVIKELQFGTNARDTNDAFFAADTGVECALAYDKASPSANGFTGSASMNCAGTAIVPTQSPSSFWTFIVPGIGSASQSCAKVTVDKTNSTTTVVNSKGYNVGDASCVSSNTNRVERELQITYGGASATVALNFDFEDGAVGSCPTNWTCTGDAVTAAASDGQGCIVASGINNNQYLKAGCDSTVGTAQSSRFTLPYGIDHVRALRAGGADASTDSGWFVKRASDDAILCSAQNGADTDTFFTDDCTGLGSDAGIPVYIYVVDNQNSGWGKTYLDNIELMDASDNILLPY